MGSNFIIRKTTPDVLTDLRIATKDIQYIETHDKRPAKWYKLHCRKGDTYKYFKLFPWPHSESRMYDITMAESTFTFTKGETYTEKEMNDMGYIIEGDTIYEKPYIIICYGIDKKLKINYDSTSSMMRAWENLKFRFEKLGLHFIF